MFEYGSELRVSDEMAEWIRMEDEGFIGLVGPLYRLPFKDGIGRFRFVPEPRHRQGEDFVSGGMLMTFADRSLGTTARQASMRRRQATVQLDVHFIQFPRIGEPIDMECRIVRETRSLAFLEGVMSVQGDVVATAKGVWKILSNNNQVERQARPQ